MPLFKACFVFLVLASVSGQIPEDDCPKECSCLDSYVDCTKLNLQTSPDSIPKWVETLDLSGNKLNESIGQQIGDLAVLQELKLNKNQLRRIPRFLGFVQLERLYLSHNRIDRITADSLEVLINLQQLDLSRNNIKAIQINAFPSRNNLRIINLNYNQIGSIQRHSLDPLAELLELKLNNNRLSEVTTDMFGQLQALKKLHLNGNRVEAVTGLPFKYLGELKVLKLRNNRIRQLMDGAFHGLVNMSALELDNNKIRNISKGWLYNLTSLHTLSLSNNSIDRIETDSWEFVQRLNTLDLSNNRLESINRRTFEGLQVLRDLLLKNNRIRSIGEWSFNNTPHLDVLDLSHNEISWTVEDMIAPFSSLKELRRFLLSSNKIKSVNQNAFVGLRSVELLDLSDNNLTTIQINAFSELINLRELLITSKSLLCDCNLKWFHSWLKELPETGGENGAAILEKLKPTCGYPVWLRGKLVLEMGVNNFTCNDSPKPKIIEEPPQTMLALKGTNLTLTCTAISSSASAMQFQWKRDNVELNGDLYKTNYLHNSEDNSTVASSILVLENVNQNHVGKYQCIVTNTFGSTYSIKNKITVGTLPTFKKIPKNVTVSSGSTIRLDCFAMGEPRPEISWQKDGGNDFPAARERRMVVMTDDDAFFIVNAKPSDQGVYSCTAENAVGIVKANATLVIQEAPSFGKTVINKEVVQGMPSVLECMANGSPKPRIRWLKDDKEIEESKRHFFAGEDQLLVIMETGFKDAGVYRCELENSLGSESAQMILTVVSKKSVVAQGFAQSHTLEIIIIAIVCCAVGTSMIWLLIIYQTKKYGSVCNFGNRGCRGGPNQSRGCSTINNSGMSHVVVEDGMTCINNYSRSPFQSPTPLIMNGPRTSLLPGGSNLENIDAVDGNLYKEIMSPTGTNVPITDIYNQRPQILTRISEEIHNAEEDLSCKDSGNGDSSKGRNHTSSDEEDNYETELDMLKEERKAGQVNIQKNHLNDYLEDDEEEEEEEEDEQDRTQDSLLASGQNNDISTLSDTNSAVYFIKNKNDRNCNNSNSNSNLSTNSGNNLSNSISNNRIMNSLSSFGNFPIKSEESCKEEAVLA